jgi:hypothetical protein
MRNDCKPCNLWTKVLHLNEGPSSGELYRDTSFIGRKFGRCVMNCQSTIQFEVQRATHKTWTFWHGFAFYQTYCTTDFTHDCFYAWWISCIFFTKILKWWVKSDYTTGFYKATKVTTAVLNSKILSSDRCTRRPQAPILT